MRPTSVPARTLIWLWPLMLALGAVTALLAWVFLALLTGRQLGWMAVLVALELLFMLRLGTLRGGPLRVVLVSAGTVLITLLAWWSIASAWLGGSMGLAPWESALRMGPHLAWTLVSLANSPMDWIWLGVATVLGAWLAR
ncbi:hypothetical protein RZA67_12440 [Stenotrophomonas sp. C3(2023)]|uniref:hypothetical protein n=1 Tax=Stenotrophomonas sp. C3(2023) TaxID=3080277 RepID=UPI00293C7FB3|nr:hypothetical protein [Stenotrophomonas sp. C3(2023)]MDV3469524.1 hypothetical protein [Stenotrophomonas sp. C3(2023)]